ncbi:MAG: hypothetical protein ACF8GE_11540 [Phycisphaerales bacterium JB043]
MNTTPCIHCTPSGHGHELVSQCVECGSATVAGLGFNVTTLMLGVAIGLGVLAFRRVFARGTRASLPAAPTGISPSN